MTTPDKDKASADRRKWILVGLLAAMLGYVCFSGGEPPDAPADDIAVNEPKPPRRSQVANVKPRPLPVLKRPIEEIAAYDPFTKPAPPARESADDPATTEPVEAERDRAAAQAALASLRVSLIYRGPEGPVAVIDSRPYRVGDSLLGSRIVAISADGVTLEPNP